MVRFGAPFTYLFIILANAKNFLYGADSCIISGPCKSRELIQLDWHEIITAASITFNYIYGALPTKILLFLLVIHILEMILSNFSARIAWYIQIFLLSMFLLLIAIYFYLSTATWGS
jgi:hypothetical protein